MSKKTRVPFNPYQMIGFFIKRIDYLNKYHTEMGGDNLDLFDKKTLTKQAKQTAKRLEAITSFFPFLMFEYDTLITNMNSSIDKNLPIEELIAEMDDDIKQLQNHIKGLLGLNKMLKTKITEVH